VVRQWLQRRHLKRLRKQLFTKKQPQQPEQFKPFIDLILQLHAVAPMTFNGYTPVVAERINIASRYQNAYTVVKDLTSFTQQCVTHIKKITIPHASYPHEIEVTLEHFLIDNNQFTLNPEGVYHDLIKQFTLLQPLLVEPNITRKGFYIIKESILLYRKLLHLI